MLTTGAGLAVVAVWMLVAILLRISRRRVSVSDVVLLTGATAVVAFNDQMTIWFAPIALWVLLPHLSEALERRSWFGAKCDGPAFADGNPVPPVAFAYTCLSCLAIWCGFALSPISSPLLHGRVRPIEQLVSRSTPIALCEFFKGQSVAPSGMVWVPEDWGDWLAFDGPRGLKVSANSQLHLLSDRQRRDIAQVTRGEGNWTRTLDHYAVEWLVVDKQYQPRLFDAVLSQGKDWSIRFEDGLTLVLRRKA